MEGRNRSFIFLISKNNLGGSVCVRMHVHVCMWHSTVVCPWKPEQLSFCFSFNANSRNSSRRMLYLIPCHILKCNTIKCDYLSCGTEQYEEQIDSVAAQNKTRHNMGGTAGFFSETCALSSQNVNIKRSDRTHTRAWIFHYFPKEKKKEEVGWLLSCTYNCFVEVDCLTPILLLNDTFAISKMGTEKIGDRKCSGVFMNVSRIWGNLGLAQTAP